MNYLAHLYLAPDSPRALIGNLMGDFARGIDPAALDPEVRAGLERHRSVDRRTDSHPRFRASCARLRGKWGHYARVLVDVAYDHCLAASWERYSPIALGDFAGRVYRALEEHRDLLSPALRAAAPRMIAADLLNAYRSFAGLEQVLASIARRSRRAVALAAATRDLEAHSQALAGDFHAFFPDLIRRVCGEDPRRPPWRRGFFPSNESQTS